MLEEQWDRTGVPPGALLEKPELDRHFAPHWQAFLTLNARRPAGFSGPLAIPVSEIACYLDNRGLADPDLRREITDVVMALDDVWLNHHHEEAERERKKREREARR